MKLKMIALAAVMVASGAANAAIATNSTVANQNDLLLNVWDSTGSFTIGIGSTLASFDAAATAAAPGDFVTLDLTGDTAFQAFINGRTSFSWDIIGVNKVSNFTTISTFAGTAPLTGTASPLVSAMNTEVNNMVNFTSAVNSGIAGATGPTNGVNSLYSTSTQSGTYITAQGSAAQGSPYKVAISGTQANNSFAAGLNLLKLTTPLSGVSTRATNTLYTGVTAYIDSGVLHVGSVSAVPEPESVAMMLAGLGLIGSIVVRRSRKA